jgi:hypothetical protein
MVPVSEEFWVAEETPVPTGKLAKLSELPEQLLVRFSGSWMAQAGTAIAILYYGICGTPEEKVAAAAAAAGRELLTWTGSSFAGRQVAMMLHAYEERLKTLAADKVDATVFGSDEYACLVANAIESASRTASTAKVQMFGRLLAGALTASSTL